MISDKGRAVLLIWGAQVDACGCLFWNSLEGQKFGTVGQLVVRDLPFGGPLVHRIKEAHARKP